MCQPNYFLSDVSVCLFSQKKSHFQKNKARVRRSRSEFRPQIQGISNNDENINPLNLHPNHQIVSRKHSQRNSAKSGQNSDYNGNCHNNDTSNSDYAELSSEKKSRRESRTNQQSQVCVVFAIFSAQCRGGET